MQEKLTFPNSKGDKLVGILSNPTNSKEQPIIILCHGFNSGKDSRSYITFEDLFNEEEISTFRFDFWAHGESEGDFEHITITEAVDDILQAIKFLKEQEYSKIGLVGVSFGGISALNAASKTDELFALGLKCPVSNYKEMQLAKRSKEEIEEWKERGFRYTEGKGGKHKLNYTFFEDFDNNNGYEAAEKINIPTIIVHGDADVIVPIKQSIKVAGIIKNCKLEIIKGADHHFSKQENFDKCAELIVEFISDNSD